MRHFLFVTTFMIIFTTNVFAAGSYQCSWPMSGQIARMKLVLSEVTQTAHISSLKDPQKQYPCKMTTVPSAYSFVCAVPLVSNTSLLLISIDRTDGSATVDAT